MVKFIQMVVNGKGRARWQLLWSRLRQRCQRARVQSSCGSWTVFFYLQLQLSLIRISLGTDKLIPRIVSDNVIMIKSFATCLGCKAEAC